MEKHLQKGDWVYGHTTTGHRVEGFITTITVQDDESKLAMVCVLRACCEGALGNEWAFLDGLKQMPTLDLSNIEGYLLNAIDFALDTRDEDAFILRSSQLREIRGMRALAIPSPTPTTISA